MGKLSVFIITYNEEENIRNCLESVKWADEIIVVDSLSSDKTVEICKEYTDKIFQKKWEEHIKQKNFALSKTSYNLVLNIDADEIVTNELMEEIKKILNDENIYDGYLIPRKNFFLGKWIKHGGWYPDYTLRLFKKEKGIYGGIDPHDKVILQGKSGIIKTPFIHNTYKSLSEYIQKQNSYTTISAITIFHSKKHKMYNSFSLLLKLFSKFLEVYLYKRGFLDGFYGLIIAISSSYFAYLKYLKVWEMKNK